MLILPVLFFKGLRDCFDTCPITLSTFENPVVAEDGHTYEHTAIQHYIIHYGNKSPVTRLPMGPTLIPNNIVRKRLNLPLKVVTKDIIFIQHRPLLQWSKFFHRISKCPLLITTTLLLKWNLLPYYKLTNSECLNYINWLNYVQETFTIFLCFWISDPPFLINGQRVASSHVHFVNFFFLIITWALHFYVFIM